MYKRQSLWYVQGCISSRLCTTNLIATDVMDMGTKSTSQQAAADESHIKHDEHDTASQRIEAPCVAATSRITPRESHRHS